jgi:HAT1-interacting factor 1
VKTNAAGASTPEITVETALEYARRAFALKKYEQAVEHYATALELQYVIQAGLTIRRCL